MLVFIACVLLYASGSEKPALVEVIDHRTMDIMFRIRGEQPESGQVVIVDIDEKSLGRIGQWPWPRNILAKLTRNLIDSRARAIGFDIIFAEPDRTSPAYFFKSLDKPLKKMIPKNLLADLVKTPSLDYDAAFGQVLSSGPTVLGYGFEDRNDGLKTPEALPFPSGVIRLDPEELNFTDLSLISAYRAVVNHPSVAQSESEGFINVFTDEYGMTRQVPLFMIMDGIPYPSMALEVFRVGMKRPAVTLFASKKIKQPRHPVLGIGIENQLIPTDGRGQIFVNYRGPVHTFPYLSAVDVINTPDRFDLKDKFVLVGTSSTGLFDLRATPYSNAFPGVEINATIVDNLIRSDPFVYDRLTEIGLNYTLLIAGGLSLSLVLSILGPLAGTAGAFVFFAGIFIWNYYYFFLNNQYVGFTFPMICCAAILLFITVFNAFWEKKSKRFIQNAFSHYVAPDVVAQLIKNPGALSLAGEEKQLSVFFCDIRGFTTLSEKMSSQDLGNFMNDFLTRMSRIILENGGTVDKFIGDAIMAFWGAPKDDPDHARKAVRTALQLKAELDQIHNIYKKKGLPQIAVGIGINSGLMSVGNFGSRQRFDYTVMGDNVNLASRLEGANKNYGTTILISEATKELIQDYFYCRFIDKVQVKGRQEPVNLYEPLCEGSPPRSIHLQTRAFEQGVSAYHAREFEKAFQIFNALDQASPGRLYQSYLDRIKGFLEAGPPEQWKGAERRERLQIHQLTSK